MDDATPPAALMPVPPVATATNPEAPSPPAAPPLPVFVPPSVTDPVSNLDFLPVDDAFTLEMRSETIEQLVGGDALRRGESERIEAGRSHTNADLVAGRDRVRVHATLHEHTGHGLAEQAAHLHTTVDGTLDVHAGNEDTVLLAGHMSDLWDGGAAIVAAMTDDTAAGGGIRVTTPLDLWVHGLMGVEERIGTCTADAVLVESSATHYEREYGPGVHAAGLAVYTGSLYQSSRSTFRPLMRVSSGVRNLIAAGGGGSDGGGGGGDGGAGSARAASPAPASAAGGAGTETASRTLCAATGAGAGRTAQAGAMAGVRSEDLTGIHRGDDVAAPARGTNVAEASGDLTGLRRGTDTAGQLEALHDAMRGAGAGAQGEEGSVFGFPKLDDTASVHEACGPDIVVDTRPGATVPGMRAAPRPLPSLRSPPLRGVPRRAQWRRPPAADPWRIRSPGWQRAETPGFGRGASGAVELPGPSSQVVSTGTIRPLVMSIGLPPGWQRAETPGFGRGASGAVELPFSRRRAIAYRFRDEHALRRAEFVLRSDGADALDWSAARVWAVLSDLYRLNAFVFWHSARDAAMIDADWRAIEALIRVIDAPPPPSP